MSMPFSPRRALLAAISLALAGTVQAQTAAPDRTVQGAHNAKPPSETVRVENHTQPETCAEKDNIDIRFPSFWRPATVPVRVGERVEQGLHLVQVYQRIGQRMEEMLVVYPPDGYWRARPLPAKHMGWTAYGSSFMIGPVTIEGRPVVAFKEIRFEPETKTFRFSFRDGGEGSLRLDALDTDHISLEVELSGELPKDKPFAALRSMYVTETNNDAARVAWREKNRARWGEGHILDFRGGEATEFWLGRHVPSRHNMSAPDMTFSRFLP